MIKLYNLLIKILIETILELYSLTDFLKSRLIRKDPDAGKDWRQEEKGTIEDGMVGWHHPLDGHESEQALGIGDGQGGLVCFSPRGRKESDTTEWLNWLTDWYCLNIFKWSIPLKGEKKNYCVRGSRELWPPSPHPLHSSLNVDSVARPSTIVCPPGAAPAWLAPVLFKEGRCYADDGKEWLIINFFSISHSAQKRRESIISGPAKISVDFPILTQD